MRRSPLLALPLTACSSFPIGPDLHEVEVWQQPPAGHEADVLFVVGGSEAMEPALARLSAGVPSFVTALADTDFHLGLLAADFDVETPRRAQLLGTPPVITADDDAVALLRQRLTAGASDVGRDRGLEAAVTGLSGPWTSGPNAGFLRPAADLVVLFVSDRDDCSDEGRLGPHGEATPCADESERLTPVGNLVERLQELKPSRDRVRLAAIVARDDPEGAACGTEPGRRYLEAAHLTGGLTASLCEAGPSDFLVDFGRSASGIYSTFQLSHGARPGTLDVTVDDVPVPFLGYVGTDLGPPYEPAVTREAASERAGYVYEVDEQVIAFFQGWVPERGATIAVSYEIEPGT